MGYNHLFQTCDSVSKNFFCLIFFNKEISTRTKEQEFQIIKKKSNNCFLVGNTIKSGKGIQMKHLKMKKKIRATIF